jgi:glycosyltransferase involved in cell wall biosynthesis
MEEFPAVAAPARPQPDRLSVSIIIPVHNGGADFTRCLQALQRATIQPFEIVVVDDGSTDGSGDRAADARAVVIRHDDPRGPAAARNSGAQIARGELIFFLDADVLVHPDTLHRAVQRFEADPQLDALFGSYDDQPPAPGIVSAYRNLLHHYVHQQGHFVDDARPAHTFWTGCGCIRRSVFLAHGGFDPSLYQRPAIEDIELGYRLTAAGHRILLARDVQATHLKRWRLADVVHTDIFRRGVPWMLLILRRRARENDLNVSGSQRLSVALTGLALGAAALLPLVPTAGALLALALILIALLNRRFYRFLARRRGTLFAIAAYPLHLLYFICCGLSVLLALTFWICLVQAADRPPADPVSTNADHIPFPRPRAANRRSRTRNQEPSWNPKPFLPRINAASIPRTGESHSR